MFNQTSSSNQVIQLRARLCPLKLNSMAHGCLEISQNCSTYKTGWGHKHKYLFTRQMKGLRAGFLLAAVSHVICMLFKILARAMKYYWPSFKFRAH